MDWSPYFPAFVDRSLNSQVEHYKILVKPVTIADIGCGFGGLLVALAPLLSEELILGLEIRTQVTEYVQARISALRSQNQSSPLLRKESKDNVQGSHPKRENAKQWLIVPKDGKDKIELAATKELIKQISGYDRVCACTDSSQTLVHWTASLVQAQINIVRELTGVHRVEEDPKYTNIQDLSHHAPSASPSSPYPDTAVASPPDQGPFQNISVLRANTMKFLPNFFTRGQLNHIFLCFPDPHFKARKHKARIVSNTLCAEYAYVLRPRGTVYTITDVEELGQWMRERFEAFGKSEADESSGLFEEVLIPGENEEREWEERKGEEGRVGRLVRCIREETEEGKKVTRNNGKKFVSVWRRREDPEWLDEVEG